jgi:chromosome segregation ATPase
LVNPSLTGSLAADHAALENDLVQAQELAADFQRQLAGKSNEYAQLKQILEKTQTDLNHLQAGIVELRSERHGLANEAMRAAGFEAKLTKVTAERDRLRNDLELVQQAMGKKIDELTFELRDRDRRIAELVIELVVLRQNLEDAQNGIPVSPLYQTAPAAPRNRPPENETSEISLEDLNVEIVRAPPR